LGSFQDFLEHSMCNGLVVKQPYAFMWPSRSPGIYRAFPSHYEQLPFLSFLLSFGPLFYYSHCYLWPQAAMKLKHMPMIDFDKWSLWRAFQAIQRASKSKCYIKSNKDILEVVPSRNKQINYWVLVFEIRLLKCPSFILVGLSSSRLVMLYQEAALLFFKVAGRLKNGKCGQGKLRCMLFPLVIH
jgi:hypothetical protein